MTIFLVCGVGLAAALAVAAQSVSTGGRGPVATDAPPPPAAAVAELEWAPPAPEAATPTLPAVEIEGEAADGSEPLPMLVAEIVATDPDGAAPGAAIIDIPPPEEVEATPSVVAQDGAAAVAPVPEAPELEDPGPIEVEADAAPSIHPAGPEHRPLPGAVPEGGAPAPAAGPEAPATPSIETAPIETAPIEAVETEPAETEATETEAIEIAPAELEAAVEAVVATGIRAPLAAGGGIAPTLRPSPAEQRLAECLVTAQTQPEAGLAAARGWEAEGGGAFARRCLATALLGSGDAPAAARIFEDLAREITILDPQRAVELFRSAGEAWLVADRPMSAHGIATEGLKTGRDDPGLLIIRATASMALSDLTDALAALDRALAGAERAPQLLVMRAMVLAAAGRVADALADTEAALAELPDNVDALLLRGRLRLREGDVDAAIADWRRVVEVSREGPAARQASEALRSVGAEP